MRTSRRANGEILYSPDDGDYAGFLLLLVEWSSGAAVNKWDIEDFAGRYAVTMGAKTLRTPRQWVSLLLSDAAERERT